MLSAATVARASEPVKSVTELRAALEPHGQWVSVDRWGDVWSPHDAFFRPYARGHWTVDGPDWTYHGVTEWDDLTAHYGYWIDDDLYGWVWRPDGVWKPSAVVWRMGSGTVGWTPIAPDGSVPKSSLDWVFVKGVDAVAENLQKTTLPAWRSPDLFARTQPLTAPPTEMAVLGLPEPRQPQKNDHFAAGERPVL